MILGIDVGNYSTKCSNGIIFSSKVATVGNLLGGDIEITLDNKNFYVGTGEFETEINKARKKNFINLLYTAIALSSNDIENQVVVGLPISQYKQFKEELRERIKENWYKDLIINGERRKIIITDLEIMPEGAVATENNYEGIVVDLGGKTTDCCLLRKINNKRKVLNPLSIPVGTINLYTEVIKLINSRYGLDLNINDVDRILAKGLKINGETQDTEFILDIFKSFIENLINTLKIEYSLTTEDVTIIGGGGELLFKAIKNRIPQALLMENSLFANANAYGEVGEQLWV